MSPEPCSTCKAVPTRTPTSADARPARRAGAAAAPSGPRRHGARRRRRDRCSIGGMLAVWILHARAGPRRRAARGCPRASTIPEVPSNVMLIGVWALVRVRPVGGVRGPARRPRAHRPGARPRRPSWRSPSSTPRRTCTTRWSCRSPTAGYAAMFYAITGTMLALFIVGLVFTAVTAFRFLGGRTADREIVAAHALYWYVLAAVFSAVWLSSTSPSEPLTDVHHRLQAPHRRRRPGDRRGDRSTASPRRARSAPIGLISAAARPRVPRRRSTCTPATPTSRRWTPTALDRVGRRRAGRRRRACGRSSPRSAACSSSSGWSRYPVVFIFGIIVLIAAAVEWMVQAWSERASADVGVQRRGPRAHRPPARVPGPRRRRRRHHHLLVQPDHAVPVEGERPGGVRRRSPRSSWSSASSSPSGPTSQRRRDRRRRRHRRRRARRRRRRRGARAASARCTPTRRPATLAADGECGTAEETEADEHASQTVAAKANLAAEITLAEDGTLVANEPRRHRRSGHASSSPRSNPTNVLFRNESDEERRLVLDLGTRPSRRGRRGRSPTARCPTSGARSSSRRAAASS